MNELDLGRLLARCLADLEQFGYSLEQVTDKQAGERRAAAVREKARSAPFSLGLHDFTKSELFWLFIKKDGEDIGFSAARKEKFQENELVEYWRDSYPRMYGEGFLDVTTPVPYFISQISGVVVYMGEFFIAEKERGNADLLRCYCHALFVLVRQRFEADWIYVFVPNTHDVFGLARIYGFKHFEESALVWKKVPKGRRRETFCAISATELYERAAHFLRYPDDFKVPESRSFRPPQ